MIECSEQGSGFLVLLIGAIVIGYNAPIQAPVYPDPDPVCEFAGKPTGRDAKGVQTFEYFRRCYE